MSFKSWLENLESARSVGSGGHMLRRPRRWSSSSHLRHGGTPRRPRAASPFLEQLETKITLSATTLASFIAPAGLGPQAAVIMDSNGNLYGTAEAGGTSGLGTVFELAHGSGVLTALASFNGANGANPYASLTMDTSGNLYGTASAGGASGDGTVFELAQGSGTLTALASFNGTNGLNPRAGLIQDSSGNLYGTAESSSSGAGTVFELVQGSGTITRLASFNGTNGANPYGGLIMDSNGNLYGTASAGGASHDGTVFEVAQGSGTITTLASFNGTNGANPDAGLIMDSGGNLYGTASAGGAKKFGAVFELAHGSGAITTLGSFNTPLASKPLSTLIMDSSGNLYGTMEGIGDGGVFELAKGSATITTLARFNGANGENPYAGVAMDSSGNVYGTTYKGGAESFGTVFELAQGSGTITSLASFNFPNGFSPYGGVIVDSSGNLYGTTDGGGATNHGTVFEVASGSGTITTLASFNGTNGAGSVAPLIMDSDGNLYGTAGGGASGDGTVFELAQGSGTITMLASFNGTSGQPAEGALIMDSGGNLYGTTAYGGASSDGTVFELAKGSGTITTLASFNGSDGSDLEAGLVLDSSGNLYGTAETGGASGDGTVFELVHGSGTITTLASFNGTDGQYPYGGLIMDSSGNLYGPTIYGGASNDGTVFELAHGSRKITTLASFNGTDGENPYDGLIVDSSGNLYGTAAYGGASNDGTVFELARGSGKITTLASINAGGPLVMDSSGNLYGTAGGGKGSNFSTVFEITNPGTMLALGGFPSPATAGATGTFTVTARSADGTTGTAYIGTVHVTSSDGKASLPADYTFTAADAGVHTLSATMKTAGTQSLTATDTMTGRILGSQMGIIVKPAAASQLSIGGRTVVTHGVAFSLTLSVVDAYGNMASGYVGTVHFSSSAKEAMPANYTFTAADAGHHTFINNVALKRKGTQTLTVTDTLNSALTASISIKVM